MPFNLPWRRVAVLCGVAALVAVPTAMADGTSNSQSPLFHNVSGTCAGADVGQAVASGNVTAHRNPNGTETINIVIRNGLPNATYYPNILCVGWFGELTTNSQGNGAGHYVLDSGVPPTFVVSLETQFNPNTGETLPVQQDTYTSAVLTSSS